MNGASVTRMPKKQMLTAPPVQFYITATASFLERRPRTLKYGDTFGVFDHYGDVISGKGSPEGLFHNDTRYLSDLRLLINGKRPLLLSSTVRDNNAVLSADLTNPDLIEGHRLLLARDTVHILRSKFIWRDTCSNGSAFAVTMARVYTSTLPFCSPPILPISSRFVARSEDTTARA